MPVIICMFRGVNVGGRNKIKMDELKLCLSLKFKSPQTFIQSGNVVFCADEKDMAKLTKRMEDALEKKFDFRPGVVLRTMVDLRSVIAKNPFAGRKGIDPGELLVNFLADDPGKDARKQAQAIETARMKCT